LTKDAKQFNFNVWAEIILNLKLNSHKSFLIE